MGVNDGSQKSGSLCFNAAACSISICFNAASSALRADSWTDFEENERVVEGEDGPGEVSSGGGGDLRFVPVAKQITIV